MKIVLKHDNLVKLYDGEMTYSQLLKFIEEQMMVKIDTVAIQYTDQDGDNISIASDQDLNIMEAISNGKEYTKVAIKGEKI